MASSVSTIVFASLALAVVACGAKSHDRTDAARSASADSAVQDGNPAPFSDGEWELRVNLAWDGVSGNPSSPTDVIPDSAYKPSASGIVYRVVASRAAAHVTIGDTPFEGELSTAKDASRSYALTTGTFADGRFLLWARGSALEAELTLYGSGRPVVKSERGPLVRLR